MQVEMDTDTGQQIIVLCDNSSPTRGEGKFDWKREEVFTLLEYISDVFPKLNDRSTGKGTIWKEVAEKFCNSRITALRCSQKWANLEKIYNNYIKSQKQTGEGRKKPPPYFDEVDSILRGKHKIFPPLVLDSETPIAITDNIPLPLREVENTLDLEELVDNPEVPQKRQSLFENPKKRIKQNNRNELLSSALNELKESRKEQKEVMQSLITLQQSSSTQMIDLLKIIVEKK